MSFHQVKVDEEIFEFVKRHAEPLVDSFNSTLRRLLLSSSIGERAQSSTPSPEVSGELNSPPTETPQGLWQVLKVIQLVRQGTYTRIVATRSVAEEHRVAVQTVLDKYCRQLKLTAAEFDRLLADASLLELRQLLVVKFPACREVIDSVLAELTLPKAPPPDSRKPGEPSAVASRTPLRRRRAQKPLTSSPVKALTGKLLNQQWKVKARHALYHHQGIWYHQLREFPGALFDYNGYVLFESKNQFVDCPYLKIRQDVNVPAGISALPGYVHYRAHPR